MCLGRQKEDPTRQQLRELALTSTPCVHDLLTTVRGGVGGPLYIHFPMEVVITEVGSHAHQRGVWQYLRLELSLTKYAEQPALLHCW